jgi:hypothetical protein
LIKYLEPPDPDYKLTKLQENELIALVAGSITLNDLGFSTKVTKLWVRDETESVGYIELVRIKDIK